jgi:hypothetical protein
MIELSSPQDRDEIINATFKLDRNFIDQNTPRKLGDRVAIESDLLGDECKVSIGMPISNDVSDDIWRYRGSLTHQASQKLYSSAGKKWQICAIDMRIGFLPGRHVFYEDARFSISFQTNNPEQDRVVVLDMQPKNITERKTVNAKYEVGLGLKLNFVEIAPKIDVNKKKIVWEPKIIAFEEYGDQPTWEFRTTSSSYLSGTHPLFMLIMFPAGLKVKGRFKLEARIKTKIGILPIPRFIIDGTNEILASQWFDLCA